ncbi:MAG: acetyl-CoA carboxylase biotin carboxyl carrier protein [Candidatus Eisenbacteria bacterium]|nr:acetyl-CoA carboxylase biotin carboxyl carrier protein [Candidatus Eisenbacteria bacterium]
MKEKKAADQKLKEKRKEGQRKKLGRKGNSDSSDFLKFDKDELRKLIAIVEKSEVEELEISRGSGSIRIKKPSQFTGLEGGKVLVESYSPGLSRGRVQEESAVLTKEAAEKKTELVPIKSPMVGTFYGAPAPDADPYTEVGAFVDVGQVVCIVEAMKLMNEIESDVAGRIIEIPVQNAQPVEYGQTLFLVDTKAKR